MPINEYLRKYSLTFELACTNICFRKISGGTMIAVSALNKFSER